MRKKLFNVMLSLVLVMGMAPHVAWAESAPFAECADLGIQEPANADEARQAVADAQADVDAAQAVIDRGSLGFFESVGATRAVDALTNALYASYTHIGGKTDATSLPNMKAAIDIVERCNQIRIENDLNELMVTDYLMATSQSDANYSDKNIEHAQQFNVGENLAWNWFSGDLSYGAKYAFVQWYDNEKAIWDNARATGEYTSKFGGTYQIPASAFELSSYELSQQYSDFYLNVGHYLNVISSDYVVSGGAINSNGTRYGATYAQNFYFADDGEESYSVAEYRERFMEYYDGVYKDLDDAKNRLLAAKAALKSYTITDTCASVSATTFAFNGQARKPAVEVMLRGKKLNAGDDYTVTYKNNVGVGKATVTITGKGDYVGTASKTFTIVPKGTAIVSASGSPKAFTVKWKKQSTKMFTSTIAGYQIRYSTSSKMTKAKTSTIKGYKSTSKKIVKLKKKTRYYVQARTYKTVNGKTYFSAWSSKKSVRTK